MQAEFEARDDSEIAAAPTECPEQVGILLFAGASHLTIGGDHICADQIIDRHPELSRGPPETTTQGEPGDACGRIDADRSCQTKGLGLAIEVTESCPRLDPSGSRCSIDPNGSHLREIDQQSSISDGFSRDVVSCSTNGNEEIVLPSKAHRLNDIRGAGATHHKTGALVDTRIPDCSGLIVAGVAGQENLTAQDCTQSHERFRRYRCVP